MREHDDLRSMERFNTKRIDSVERRREEQFYYRMEQSEKKKARESRRYRNRNDTWSWVIIFVLLIFSVVLLLEETGYLVENAGYQEVMARIQSPKDVLEIIYLKMNDMKDFLSGLFIG